MHNNMRTAFFARWLPLALCAGVLAGCASSGRAPVTAATGDGYGASSSSRAPSQSIRTTTMAREHTVRAGEGLYSISRQYGVSTQDLRAWNAGQNLDALRVGQRLYVSPPGGTLIGGSTGGGTLIGGSGASAPVSSTASVGGAVAEARPIEMQPMLPLTTSSPDAAAPAPVQTESTITGAQFATSGTSPSDAALAPAPAPAANNWLWPTNGEVIKGFGNGSKGLDIAGKVGDPVQAAAGGTVAYAGSGLRGLGKLIVIRHDNDYLTAYAHNSKLLVKEGDKVQAGQKIAEVGDSDASRPMLHFELRKGGSPVDPANHLPKR